jgi:hypothetical protein
VRRGDGWWTRAWSFVSEETVLSTGRRCSRFRRLRSSWPWSPSCAADVLLRRCVSLWESGSPGTRGVACPRPTRSSRGCGAGGSTDALVVEVVGRVRRLAAGDVGRPRLRQRSIAEEAAGDLGAEVGCRSYRLAGRLRGRPGGSAERRGCREKLVARDRSRRGRCGWERPYAHRGMASANTYHECCRER